MVDKKRERRQTKVYQVSTKLFRTFDSTQKFYALFQGRSVFLSMYYKQPKVQIYILLALVNVETLIPIECSFCDIFSLFSCVGTLNKKLSPRISFCN